MWAKLGLVLAFLAVPVGSYFIVTHYIKANEKLQQKVATLEFTNKSNKETIEFLQRQKDIETTIDKRIDDAFNSSTAIIERLDNVITPLEDQPSSAVLKETVRILKEASK